MSLIISVSGIVLTTVIRCGIDESSRIQDQKKYWLLYRLGASHNYILANLLIRSIAEVITGTGVSVIALLIYRTFQEKYELLGYADYIVTSTRMLYFDSLSRTIQYTDWTYVIVAVLAVLLINTIIIFVHDLKTTQLNGDTQLD